jgi:hypothetical protein
MAWTDITDGESGSSVRTKLNTLGTEVDTKASKAFVGVKLFPVVPFTPLVGVNPIEFNSPLIQNGGTFYNGANPTRLTIPALPGNPTNPIGIFTGNISFLGGGPSDVKLFIRLGDEIEEPIALEGITASAITSPGKLSFSTGPFEVAPGDFFELAYEFSDVTDKIIQIIGTSLSFHYLGEDV